MIVATSLGDTNYYNTRNETENQSTEYECDNKHNKISWGDTLTGLYGGEQLKKFLKCGSLLGVVCPAFLHDFIHF